MSGEHREIAAITALRRKPAGQGLEGLGNPGIRTLARPQRARRGFTKVHDFGPHLNRAPHPYVHANRALRALPTGPCEAMRAARYRVAALTDRLARDARAWPPDLTARDPAPLTPASGGDRGERLNSHDHGPGRHARETGGGATRTSRAKRGVREASDRPVVGPWASSTARRTG
jgi:hypothetical protein